MTKRKSKRTRKYAAAEALAGVRLADARALPAKRESTRAVVVGPRPSRVPAKLATKASTLAPAKKLQALVEKTVATLLVTATQEGDLTFRADLKAEVLSDVSVDVTLWGKQLVITFYSTDASSRRLLQGYERELRAHLESRGLKVRAIRFASAPDPDEAPPIKLT